MVLKVEIRTHDGMGRLTKIKSNDKIIQGPNLVEPVQIPAYHESGVADTIPFITKTNKSTVNLGYLPALHKFSNFSSEEEVIDAINSEYYSKIKTLDFVAFPLDKASSLRTTSNYPSFILQASQKVDLNFAWIFVQNDSKTDWSELSQLPLMITGDLSTIYKNQRQTWKYLVDLENNYPLSLKYAPSIPPALFSLYAYLGIDFFDSLFGQYMAQNNVFLDTEELISVPDKSSFQSWCPCSACEQIQQFSTTKEWLKSHNQKFTESMIQKVQYSLSQGTLRDLVKKQILIDPNTTALLRIADLENEQALLDKYNPTFKKQKLLLTSNSDYIRPEIRMFHKRVKERFSIPEWTQAVLLIPCSAKKPYSESKSHRIFASTIKNALRGKRYSVLDLIVTSPLGVVPRFVEQVYPAGMYDIPVTGNWSELEQNIVEDMLLSIFSQLKSTIPIISYLAEPERSIIASFSEKYPNYNITILNLPESEIKDDSLKMLREHLFSIKDDIAQTSSKNSYELEFFKAMADYQFGKNAGNIIFTPETEIKRKGYMLTAFSDNNQLATLHLGHVSLTVFAASKLAASFDSYKVFFADEELNGSAIYTPGITKADRQIRPEDDVLVISQKTGEFLALGKSHLSGFELENCNYGLGVSIKKKFK